jgi:hypothetical protein
MLVGTLWRTINNTITKLELLANGVQRNVAGTQIYVYTNDKAHMRQSGWTPIRVLNDTLKGICPRDHLI